MIRVELELEDANEMQGVARLMAQVEQYRAHKGHDHGDAGLPPENAGTNGEDPVAEATYAADEKPDAPIIAQITPSGVVKAPKEADLNAAALAYSKKHGLDAALKVVGEFGASKVSEIKDPVKQAAIYYRFVEGVK